MCNNDVTMNKQSKELDEKVKSIIRNVCISARSFEVLTYEDKPNEDEAF
jgi:hypothetical protein